MSEIIQHLHRDHVNMAKIMDTLDAQLDAIHSADSVDFELMQDMLRYMTHYPDLFHHPREDLVFARLAERDESARPVVEELEQQHKEIIAAGSAFLEYLEKVVDGTLVNREELETKGRDYVELQRRHMNKEEGEVFPLATKTLQDDDWSEMDTLMQSPGDPLFGEVIKEEYRLLLEYIEQQSK